MLRPASFAAVAASTAACKMAACASLAFCSLDLNTIALLVSNPRQASKGDSSRPLSPHQAGTNRHDLNCELYHDAELGLLAVAALLAASLRASLLPLKEHAPMPCDRTWRIRYTPAMAIWRGLFYVPAPQDATRYHRLTGHVTSGALALAARASKAGAQQRAGACWSAAASTAWAKPTRASARLARARSRAGAGSPPADASGGTRRCARSLRPLSGA